MSRSLVCGYELQEEIGEGEFGKVFLAKNKSGTQFAIKMISLPNIASNPSLQSFLAKETRILMMLSHPNIIEFCEEFQHNGFLFIVYEYCNQGNVHKLIKQRKGLEEQLAIHIAREILEALRELEKVGIIHRDIKPENILLKEWKVKLADFGLSTQADQQTRRLVGSPVYMAPESLRNYVYSFKSDIYALGVTLYKMILDRYPFFDPSMDALIDQKEKFNPDTLPVEFSPTLRMVLAQCLQPRPENRPSASSLLSFITSHFPQIDPSNLPERRKSPIKTLTVFTAPQTNSYNTSMARSSLSPVNPLHKRFGNSTAVAASIALPQVPDEFSTQNSQQYKQKSHVPAFVVTPSHTEPARLNSSLLESQTQKVDSGSFLEYTLFDDRNSQSPQDFTQSPRITHNHSMIQPYNDNQTSAGYTQSFTNHSQPPSQVTYQTQFNQHQVAAQQPQQQSNAKQQVQSYIRHQRPTQLQPLLKQMQVSQVQAHPMALQQQPYPAHQPSKQPTLPSTPQEQYYLPRTFPTPSRPPQSLPSHSFTQYFP